MICLNFRAKWNSSHKFNRSAICLLVMAPATMNAQALSTSLRAR